MKASAIQVKAARVAQVFDALAWVIIGLGVLGVGLSGAAFLIALLDGRAPALYLFSAIGIGLYAAVMWASVSLATIVAGYISNRVANIEVTIGQRDGAPWARS